MNEETEKTSETESVADSATKPDSGDAKPEDQAAKPKPADNSILQFKVTLRYITPPIWRRIQVSNTDTFHDLLGHIKEAMGWISDRSHQFIVYNPETDSNILIVNAALGGLIYDFDKEGDSLLKEQETKISRFFLSVGDVVLLEFDLADSWLHEIVLEKVLPPPPPTAKYPKCTGGERACPPEDCGGVDGYQNLVEAITDPAHEEHEDMIDWIEDMCPGFDPEKFDHKMVFRRVRMLVQM